MSDRKSDLTGAPKLSAVLFDMDGVITDSAEAHMAAWTQLFDTYLQTRDRDAEPFSEADYRAYVDGKPRYDGVRSFLASRDIALPFGDLGDSPELETVCGLGNRKNRHFQEWLAQNKVECFPGSRALLAELEASGIRVGVFSSSRNARAVLGSAGVLDGFEVRVDGADMAEAGLPGKPDPAIMQRACDQLGVTPDRTAIIEDAISGIAAGVAGGFAQVIGVDRDGNGAALKEAGAGLVVSDLAELAVGEGPCLVARSLQSSQLVWQARDDLRARIQGKRLVVFLDYDGTLSPIVDDPAAATLSDSMRAALKHLAARVPVGIVSGRDLGEVQAFVDDDSLYFAGSHGFDLAGPNGWHEVVELGQRFLPTLAAAADDLETRLSSVDGARVERKRFSLAVHFRQVAADAEAAVAQAVQETIARYSDLRASAGKKVYDIKPRADWHKGRAVLSLLATLDLEGDDVLPVYVGDDTTDEDAFRSLSDRGIGVVVRDGPDRRTAARFALEDTGDVECFLLWLADASAGEARQ